MSASAWRRLYWVGVLVIALSIPLAVMQMMWVFLATAVGGALWAAIAEHFWTKARWREEWSGKGK